MKRTVFAGLFFSLLLCTGLARAQQQDESLGEPSFEFTPKATAQAAAVADSVSTYLALAGGATELNPLVNTSPIGLVALVGAKLMLVEYSDKMPPEKRAKAMQIYSTFWGGASASNLMLAASVAPPVALAVGLATAYYLWKHHEEQQAKAQQATVLAQTEASSKAAAPVVVMVVADASSQADQPQALNAN
jgi:ABC-type spermidine/putrescine transport system permease subunit II